MADLPERLTDALAGRYRVERLLGSGGMADVYVAQDLKHPRRVAIKVLKPELAALLGRERFLREIELAATLQHPYILALWDSGVAGDLLYYVMPYLEGDTLRQRLEREKQLPLEDALRITGELAEALDYAHLHGVVHRDIKPENILFEGGHALVADFGIARAVGLAGGTQLTETGVSLGTPAYMSPEQALGGRELDGRSDQYSLACVAYELLAGQPPFTGATAESIVHQHVVAPPRPVTDLRAAVPAAVATALTRALAKAPADRYASTGELARALGMVAAASSTSEAAKTRVTSRVRQRRLALAVAGLVVVAGAWLVMGRGALWKHVGGDDASPPKRDWILVAEFEGPSQDPGLATAARELVCATLDESRIVTSVPRSQLRLALELAGKPESTRVTADVAQELAYRTTVRAVIEGHLEQVARGCTIVLRVVDVEGGHPIFTASGTARNQQDLIPTLQKLTVRLRKGLGENVSLLGARRSSRQGLAGTPSFEAYRKYAQAYELQQTQGDDRGSLILIREALELDPDFAAAWELKFFAFNHLGQQDSMLAALDEALRRPHRLTDDMKLECQALAASSRQDPAVADAAYRELERRGYDLASTYGNHAGLLAGVGRFQEALVLYERAMNVGPFGAQQWILTSRLGLLLRFRMLDEAREVLAKMKGWMAERDELAIAITADDWARVDSISRAFASDPSRTPDVRALALRAASSSEAARGALARAKDGAGRWFATAHAARNRGSAQLALRSHLLLTVAAGDAPGPLPVELRSDTSVAGLHTQAAWAVARGDLEVASKLERLIEERGSKGPLGEASWATINGAWVEGRSGRWEKTTEGLAGFAGRPEEVVAIGPQTLLFGRWILADAWAHLSRPDSTAAVLELALSPDRQPWGYRLSMRMISSFAHQRLVLLYSRMGQLEPARRHWEAFAKAFDDPDPELRPLVDEARNALAAAEGMAKSTRR